MILSDGDIRKAVANSAIGITPFADEQVQPASYDLTLDLRFKAMVDHRKRLDPLQPTDDLYSEMEVKAGDPYLLRPGQFVLGSTIESVRLPANIQGHVDGKSSLARLGLIVHQTGGFIDPGFDGTVTLEFSCVCPMPIFLWPGMRIAQISFTLLNRAADYPYGSERLHSKYQHQDGPEGSRYYLNGPSDRVEK